MFYPVKRRNNAEYADPFANIFDQFFGDAYRGSALDSELAPHFEITEKADAYEVVAELPGLAEENISIVVDEDILTVRGEKKAEEEGQEKSYILSERRYGSFERRFKLPETVTQEAISAGYANGVLTLTLPKKPEAKKPEPRKISIQR